MKRAFHCTTVDELVQITLKSRRAGGFSNSSYPFVQCDQHECQYVDENVSPCPLNTGMFAEEIAEKARRKAEAEYY